MKQTGLAVIGAICISAFGCGGGGDHQSGSNPSSASASSGVSTSPGLSDTSYQNGHPISLSTSDSHTLHEESEVVRIVNEYRVSIGLNALVSTAALSDVARAHSLHMIIHDFFAHQNPEGDSPGQRILKGGILWSMAGENLAAGYTSPETAFDAWMNSPGHKENIERAEWVFTGVGVWVDPSSTYGTYYTQNFSRP